MSVKRQATTELNHENWDQDDPEEHEEMGTFKTASKDVLEKRVIRTAKRRVATSDEGKKTVFGGFGGFNKSQPSSFDFLSKLTNGGNSTGSVDTPKSNLFSTKPETMSGLFSNKSDASSGLFVTKASSPNSGPSIFGSQTSAAKSGFESGGSKSLFGTSGNNADPGAFTTTKPVSTVAESPFKSLDTSEHKSSATQAAAAPVSFGIPATTANDNKSVFSSSTSTPFKIQPVSNASSNFGAATKTDSANKQKSSGDSKNDKKLEYYSKLKGLNDSVSSWIKEHVEKTPLCILSPIFKDYDKYLKEIQDEFFGSEKVEDKNTTGNDTKQEEKNTDKPVVTDGNKGSSLFGSASTKSSFEMPNKTSIEKPGSFSFGIKTTVSPSSTSNTATKPGFSFGVTPPSNQAAPTSSPFSFATNTTTNGSPSTGFSFGAGKPFSFNSNVQPSQQTTEKTDDANDEDDTPPKVEFTPVAEENSVYDKRCKVFVKKDGNFVDKGVGTLYLKKVEETGKHQLLIRANTNLGTILVNLILVSAIPTQRMGKNNVMLVCIPTPDAKPPPTPILIRVKTSEEADELLETLNNYKT